MTRANWLWLTFSLVATLIFTVIVWIGGPLIVIDDSQPLGGLYTRLLIILVVWTIVLGVIGWKVWKRRRAAAKLRKAMTESAEEDGDARGPENQDGRRACHTQAHEQIGRRRAL